MTGGTLRHRDIVDRITASLNPRLVARGCRAYRGDVNPGHGAYGSVHEAGGVSSHRMIAHFLLVEQASRDVLCLTRDGDRWVARAASGSNEVDLAALGVTLAVGDIHGDVESDAVEPA